MVDRTEIGSARGLALVVLAATAAAYLPSLGGGWIWDDVRQIADPTPFHDLRRLVTMDVWGALDDAPSDLYRPLALLSHVPGQVLWPGPLSERLVSLALHLLNVGLVAALGRGLGAPGRTSWVAAALFGLHPMASETVAWISARHDLLATTLLLGGLVLLTARRDGLAAVLLALPVFCKEPFLLTPAVVAIVLLGQRRYAWKPLAGAVGGVLAYLGIRAALDLPLPAGSLSLAAQVGALGATGLRFLELLIVPTSADAFPLFASRSLLGALFVVLGAAGIALSRGRPALALVVGAALVVAPGASASAQNGFLADRYYYVLLAAVLAAVAASTPPRSLEHRTPGRDRASRRTALRGRGATMKRVWTREEERRRARGAERARRPRDCVFGAPGIGLAVAALLGTWTWGRAGDWVSNEALYGASLERDPHNGHAAFHVAHDLHVRAGDCEAAVPLYRVGMYADSRAGNNLQACLIAMSDWEGAADLGPRLLAADPTSATPACNTAFALAALRRFPEAEAIARECVRRDPGHVKGRILLGRLLALGGVPDEAALHFGAALELEPGNVEAAERLEALELEPPDVEGAERLESPPR